MFDFLLLTAAGTRAIASLRYGSCQDIFAARLRDKIVTLEKNLSKARRDIDKEVVYRPCIHDGTQ